jgi:hypothetical protein
VTPRCALAGVAASEPAIVATATTAANVFLIQGLLYVHAVRSRDRTINDAKKSPPLHFNPRRAVALMRAGFELLVAKS